MKHEMTLLGIHIKFKNRLMIEYRIKEVKPFGPYRNVFYPQMKAFLVWKNIGKEYSFVTSSSNPLESFTKDDPYTYKLWEAEAVINAYKLWTESRKSYVKIHKPL